MPPPVVPHLSLSTSENNTLLSSNDLTSSMTDVSPSSKFSASSDISITEKAFLENSRSSLLGNVDSTTSFQSSSVDTFPRVDLKKSGPLFQATGLREPFETGTSSLSVEAIDNSMNDVSLSFSDGDISSSTRIEKAPIVSNKSSMMRETSNSNSLLKDVPTNSFVDDVSTFRNEEIAVPSFKTQDATIRNEENAAPSFNTQDATFQNEEIAVPSFNTQDATIRNEEIAVPSFNTQDATIQNEEIAVPSFNTQDAKIRNEEIAVPSFNTQNATIRNEEIAVPSFNTQDATIRNEEIAVPSFNTQDATIRNEEIAVPSFNTQDATIQNEENAVPSFNTQDATFRNKEIAMPSFNTQDATIRNEQIAVPSFNIQDATFRNEEIASFNTQDATFRNEELAVPPFNTQDATFMSSSKKTLTSTVKDEMSFGTENTASTNHSSSFDGSSHIGQSGLVISDVHVNSSFSSNQLLVNDSLFALEENMNDSLAVSIDFEKPVSVNETFASSLNGGILSTITLEDNSKLSPAARDVSIDSNGTTVFADTISESPTFSDISPIISGESLWIVNGTDKSVQDGNITMLSSIKDLSKSANSLLIEQLDSKDVDLLTGTTAVIFESISNNISSTSMTAETNFKQISSNLKQEEQIPFDVINSISDVDFNSKIDTMNDFSSFDSNVVAVNSVPTGTFTKRTDNSMAAVVVDLVPSSVLEKEKITVSPEFYFPMVETTTANDSSPMFFPEPLSSDILSFDRTSAVSSNLHDVSSNTLLNGSTVVTDSLVDSSVSSMPNVSSLDELVSTNTMSDSSISALQGDVNADSTMTVESSGISRGTKISDITVFPGTLNNSFSSTSSVSAVETPLDIFPGEMVVDSTSNNTSIEPVSTNSSVITRISDASMLGSSVDMPMDNAGNSNGDAFNTDASVSFFPDNAGNSNGDAFNTDAPVSFFPDNGFDSQGTFGSTSSSIAEDINVITSVTKSSTASSSSAITDSSSFTREGSGSDLSALSVNPPVTDALRFGANDNLSLQKFPTTENQVVTVVTVETPVQSSFSESNSLSVESLREETVPAETRITNMKFSDTTDLDPMTFDPTFPSFPESGTDLTSFAESRTVNQIIPNDSSMSAVVTGAVSSTTSSVNAGDSNIGSANSEAIFPNVSPVSFSLTVNGEEPGLTAGEIPPPPPVFPAKDINNIPASADAELFPPFDLGRGSTPFSENIPPVPAGEMMGSRQDFRRVNSASTLDVTMVEPNSRTDIKPAVSSFPGANTAEVTPPKTGIYQRGNGLVMAVLDLTNADKNNLGEMMQILQNLIDERNRNMAAPVMTEPTEAPSFSEFPSANFESSFPGAGTSSFPGASTSSIPESGTSSFPGAGTDVASSFPGMGSPVESPKSSVSISGSEVPFVASGFPGSEARSEVNSFPGSDFISAPSANQATETPSGMATFPGSGSNMSGFPGMRTEKSSTVSTSKGVVPPGTVSGIEGFERTESPLSSSIGGVPSKS
ncbi:serine-rich adhesin for platelets-like isoform X2 [Mytilus trossulus]|uniref:serine-rich adhesin for platelets-like isoform X2 n=1 Tax=Mytilus trossulus TaxID=6551 RepID=UPI003005456F